MTGWRVVKHLNIVYLAHRVPYPPNKGEKLRTYHQIKGFIAHGAAVTVLCSVETDLDIAYCQQLERMHPACQVRYHRTSLKLIRYLRSFVANCAISESYFFSGKLLKELHNVLTKTSVDAVICTASSMAPYIEKSRRYLSSKTLTIMDFMDLDSYKWQQYAENAGLVMRFVYQREAKKVAALEQVVAERFDSALLVAEPETQLFRDSQPQATCRILTVGNGIDGEEFLPAASPIEIEPPRLLFAGVMDYAPNVDAVLWFYEHVWAAVRRRWPGATFTIAGMNPAPTIQALAGEEGIRVTGFVDDILPYFHQSTLFVAPFRIARGLQNKILQAMACGLPVISTTVGAEGIEADDGVHILIADSADLFLKTIEVLTSDHLRYAAVRREALATINRVYSWSQQLAPLRELVGAPQLSDEFDQ
ncbi:TIGR03087 family PEP-CTERM/XrtA system glycosyltransferase [Halochromatium roseum]|uniref:TIGR03087 family PEP-CTERM/XrtA system glycosyltransferase n=1 Tax=Halochromatium roseum TaxID=391920 RepID=UPI0019144FB6|nr:TIGR03087 family PEP-CTERM/XrtA system glycosyltransferase [Halochromatium roseum]MBK5940325.1 hypothetical protein [Halochromatium roseum]